MVNTHSKQASLYTLLLALIIFLVPSNLFFKLSVEGAYVHGILVDYLIPKLFLSDLVILIFIAIFAHSSLKKLIHAKNWNKTNKILGGISIFLLGMLVVKQLYSPVQTASLYYLFKILFIGIFTAVAVIHKKLFNPIIIFSSLAATVIFQSLVSLYQFFMQKPVYGYLFFGETNISETFGIPNAMLFGSEKILPHGTAAHPNILGGILAVFMLIMIGMYIQELRHIQKKKIQLTLIISVVLGSIVLFLTQSISAWLTFSIGLVILFFMYLVKNISFSPKKTYLAILALTCLSIVVISPFIVHTLAGYSPQNDSLTRRNHLNQAAAQMIQNAPLSGVGLNAYTAQLETYATNPETIRFVQPTHHAGLLLLAEAGILGIITITGCIIFFLSTIQSIKTRKTVLHGILLWALILAPIAVLDHYLLTSQSGLLLGGVIIFISAWCVVER